MHFFHELSIFILVYLSTNMKSRPPLLHLIPTKTENQYVSVTDVSFSCRTNLGCGGGWSSLSLFARYQTWATGWDRPAWPALFSHLPQTLQGLKIVLMHNERAEGNVHRALCEQEEKCMFSCASPPLSSLCWSDLTAFSHHKTELFA